MRLARALLIFSFGLFTIAAQSLLFRDFLTTFEGNDISVGMFFGSWFLWVGGAATLVYRSKTLANILLKRIELLFLCYLPAFIGQLILIVQARELAGLESYALWSVRAMLVWSIVINAPVSLVTGLLFPTACRWIQSKHNLAVSRVYIIEAAGSFAGGLGVTVLLWHGASPAAIFFILAAIVSASVFAVRLAGLLAQPSLARKIACASSALLVVAFLLSLAAGADQRLTGYLRVVKWSKLLPKEALGGSFVTPQAEYLYGEYRGQWVAVREGGICEALPDKATTGQIAAISLCQNPSAESVLVVGSGLGLCTQFLQLPQIKNITWAHPDTEYARQIDSFLPPDMTISDARFHRPTGDIRTTLAEKEKSYDIVILNLPDATSSVLNRYYTLEFYSRIKRSLRPDGVLAVRVTAGENIMGTELINLGASIKMTLEKVFSRLVLTPGEQTWFIASDSEALTPDPAELRDRFASIEEAANVFSPQALLSVYLPDRAAAALESYSHADLPEHLLINRDSRPLTHLYSLLLAAKQSGAPLTRLAKLLALAGTLVFLVPVVVFVVLRLLYILGTAPGDNKSPFDSSFLVFSAGAVGIGTVIVLMYLYQTCFGSLYLHIGIISSLFMAGLTIAAALTGRLLRTIAPKQNAGITLTQIILFAVVAAHTLIITAIALIPPERWGRAAGAEAAWQSGHLIFAAAFVLCGLCAGCYFPIAARRLADCGFETGRAAARLETADHLGAAVGGVVTSLALVPLLGIKGTLLIFVLVMLANVPPNLLAMLKRQKLYFAERPTFIFRRLGYVLFGAGATVVVCSNLLVHAGARLRPSLPYQTAQALAGELRLVSGSSSPGRIGKEINYFNVHRTDPNALETQADPAGYVFSSEDLAPDVRGFGGKMNLAVYVDTTGKLIDFHVVRSNETPSYLELLVEWRASLKGGPLFGTEPFADIDTVSGATVSSQAILSALESSSRTFAADILRLSVEAVPESAKPGGKYLPDAHAAYLIGAFVLALILTYFGGFWTRLAMLAATFLLGGILLNAQYSIEQIATILSLHTPAVKLSGAFLLVAGLPLLVALFGNTYCGYICPFGAAQELLGYVVPARLKSPLSLEKMRKARFVKYGVLLVLVLAFFLSRDRTTLAADPLIRVFSLQFFVSQTQGSIFNWRDPAFLILVVVLVGSILYTRFWCRYLCPVGAFLSLFNKVSVFKRFLPAKKFGRCEFGLTGRDQLDCIYCDKCRYQARPSTRPARLLRTDDAQLGPLSRYLVVGVLAAAVLVSASCLDRFLQVMPAAEDYPSAFIGAAGQPRDVDMKRLRTLIEQKKLSDREAEFYKKLD